MKQDIPPTEWLRTDSSGQAYTLEAVVAGLLLLTSIWFALQMTAVTPLSASTSSQHVENQLKGSAEGILAAAAADGELKDAVLDWDEDAGQFNGASQEIYHTSTPPNNAFGDILARAFKSESIAYNVHVEYQLPSGKIRSQRMVYNGQPSDHAVSASRMVTLVDDDYLLEPDGRIDWDHNITNASANFYVPDAFPDPNSSSDRGLYNHLRVKVIAWRI